uniref:Hes related family bHLH transcription factor with YRPW motif 1 n=1 Tax=Homo sapiens TaxID=9606 RepID=A0A6I8PU82_HUMAN
MKRAHPEYSSSDSELDETIEKLEFGSRFHVPNYIFPDFGQKKTERNN